MHRCTYSIGVFLSGTGWDLGCCFIVCHSFELRYRTRGPGAPVRGDTGIVGDRVGDSRIGDRIGDRIGGGRVGDRVIKDTALPLSGRGRAG